MPRLSVCCEWHRAFVEAFGSEAFVHHVNAAVVLAAGAYGSPGILLRSGIGPDSGLPVGENLTDHVGTGLGWEPTELLRDAMGRLEAERPLFMAQVSVRVRSSACPEGLCDVFLFPAADPDCEITAGVFAMKPRSRGHVRLASADPRQPLTIEHGFVTEESDVAVLVEGIEVLRGLASSQPINRYAGRELRPGSEVDPETHVRATARGFFHPVGTCAIGRVVDARGRVQGYDGLIVGDASIMPTIPRANTNLTVAAIAEKLAEET